MRPVSTRVISGAAASAVDPRLDLIFVIADRVTLRRGEDDVEIVERPEALEKRAKGGDGLAVCRQQAQDVGVERETADADRGQIATGRTRRRTRAGGAGAPRRRSVRTARPSGLQNISAVAVLRCLSLACNILLLRPIPGNERFGLGPFFRIEPLGMEYIAAALEADGHSVTIADLRFGRSVDHYIRTLRPGLVGIAGMHALETGQRARAGGERAAGVS